MKIEIELTPDQYASLREYAAINKISVEAFVMRQLAPYLPDYQPANGHDGADTKPDAGRIYPMGEE